MMVTGVAPVEHLSIGDDEDSWRWKTKTSTSSEVLSCKMQDDRFNSNTVATESFALITNSKHYLEAPM